MLRCFGRSSDTGVLCFHCIAEEDLQNQCAILALSGISESRQYYITTFSFCTCHPFYLECQFVLPFQHSKYSTTGCEFQCCSAGDQNCLLSRCDRMPQVYLMQGYQLKKAFAAKISGANLKLLQTYLTSLTSGYMCPLLVWAQQCVPTLSLLHSYYDLQSIHSDTSQCKFETQ